MTFVSAQRASRASIHGDRKSQSSSKARPLVFVNQEANANLTATQSRKIKRYCQPHLRHKETSRKEPHTIVLGYSKQDDRDPFIFEHRLAPDDDEDDSSSFATDTSLVKSASSRASSASPVILSPSRSSWDSFGILPFQGDPDVYKACSMYMSVPLAVMDWHERTPNMTKMISMFLDQRNQEIVPVAFRSKAALASLALYVHACEGGHDYLQSSESARKLLGKSLSWTNELLSDRRSAYSDEAFLSVLMLFLTSGILRDRRAITIHTAGLDTILSGRVNGAVRVKQEGTHDTITLDLPAIKLLNPPSEAGFDDLRAAGLVLNDLKNPYRSIVHYTRPHMIGLFAQDPFAQRVLAHHGSTPFQGGPRSGFKEPVTETEVICRKTLRIIALWIFDRRTTPDAPLSLGLSSTMVTARDVLQRLCGKHKTQDVAVILESCPDFIMWIAFVCSILFHDQQPQSTMERQWLIDIFDRSRGRLPELSSFDAAVAHLTDRYLWTPALTDIANELWDLGTSDEPG